ncbi:MAG: serine/threonine protein kinase [Deltaproteobacteria bacterium]|nr:serine/threonine protein kinase [Deltaproteobacteria bacterium]
MTPSFGKYELQRRLAVGGMAEIFLAQVKGVEGFEKTIVLKRILPHLAEEPDFVKMFIDEAKLAATLTHPNIVQVYELGSIDNRYFIAMEYVPGIDLSTLTKKVWMAGEKFPPGAALAIGIDAARGLHYAHEKRDTTGQQLGLVHRDVSPQNILLSNEGQVKITDFGIAKAEGKSTKTRSGVLKGKFSYMAPEQAFGKQIDRRADLFALALVIYELFTNKRQYKSDNELEMLDMARLADIPPLASVLPDFPESLSKVLQKALAPKFEDRHASCAELANALAKEAGVLGETFDTDQLGFLVRTHMPSDKASGPTEHLTDSSVLALQDDDVMTTPLSDVKKIETSAGRRAVPLPPGDASGVSSVSGITDANAPKSKLPYVVGAIVTMLLLLLVAAFLKSPAPAPQEPPPPTIAQPASQAASKPAVADTPKPEARDGPGYLTVNSSPWSYVYVDGKKLNKTTPLQRYRLSAGKHRVKLESPGAERSEEFSVDIREGKTVTKIVNFSKK